MISVAQVSKIHSIAIEKFGGANGVRDLGGLQSALARPFQTFGGTDLNPTIFEKAAAIGESLIMNHPFIDGNKRTGVLAMVSSYPYRCSRCSAVVGCCHLQIKLRQDEHPMKA